MSTKFGSLRFWRFEGSDVNKYETRSSMSRGGGHVKNQYDVITPPQMARLGWNLAQADPE